MDKNTKTALSVFGIVVFMIALSFASVPLYDLFCRVTGFGGTTQVSESRPDVVLDREVRVVFNADKSRNLPWEFSPDQRQVDIRIGQEKLVSYTARNELDTPTGGTAVYNVVPLKAGKYFHKTQCFCFQEQIMQPGQKVKMPIVFYIDPSFDEDRSMDDVETITLSYTFFPAESEELDQALEDFYNRSETDIIN